MNGAKRMGALLLTCVLLIGMLPAFALAEELFGGLSTHGAFAAELDSTVYAALTTGSDFGLYAIPTDGGELRQLDVASELGELVTANGSVYYLRTKDGLQQIMRVDSEGVVSVLSDFEVDVVADHLSWYNDVLYCVANDRIYIIDPETGESELLSQELVDDYVIVNDVIFYISGSDQMTYDSGQDTDIKQSSGTLWSMSILGTNPEKLVNKGVTKLRAVGSNLFFHNLEDSYRTREAESGDIWLEGRLYRYNIETAQMASMNLSYDWDYYPTPNGVLVFTDQDLSIYPVTGGTKKLLMTPDKYCYVTALGDYAYVYEYSVKKLTRLPLDGTEALVLSDDSDVLPSIEAAGLTDETVLADDDPEDDGTADDSGEDIEDTTYNEDDESTSSGSSSTYIFPNSSKKKLTRKQVLAVSKSLWGYARNEIYARHGYSFKKSKYKNYFSKKTWYKPGGFSTSSLSSIEWYNMELIKGLEEEYGLLEGTGTASSSGSGTDNTYVLKEASSKKLSKSYLRNKLGSKSKYALARNEILARHGYVFKTEKYKKYFAKQKWYKPGGYSSSKLSKTEWYNIEQLKALEKE